MNFGRSKARGDTAASPKAAVTGDISPAGAASPSRYKDNHGRNRAATSSVMPATSAISSSDSNGRSASLYGRPAARYWSAFNPPDTERVLRPRQSAIAAARDAARTGSTPIALSNPRRSTRVDALGLIFVASSTAAITTTASP